MNDCVYSFDVLFCMKWQKWIGSTHYIMDYCDCQYQSPVIWKFLFYSILLVPIHLSLSRAWIFESYQNPHVSRHGFELIQMHNLQRQELIQSVCEQYFDRNDQLVDNIPTCKMGRWLIDEKHKFLYCCVPKVASTNWKRTLTLMTGQSNDTDPLQIPSNQVHQPGRFLNFSSLTMQQRRNVLTEYTRFIITRHPFERLLSAYRSKFVGDMPNARHFQTRIGRKIIKSFRPNASNDSLIRGHDVTFLEFIQYLLTPELSMSYQNKSSFDPHWEPAHKLCHPCALKYNVIGKYETLVDDSALALHSAGADNFTFPAIQQTSGTSEQLQMYFSRIPISFIRKLYKLYEDDFRLFGYRLESVLGFELE